MRRFVIGRSSQRKGRRSELALASLLEDLGHSAKAHGQWAKLDITVDGVPGEVKVRKNGFGIFYEALEAGAGEVYVKADRKPWLRLILSEIKPPKYGEEPCPDPKDGPTTKTKSSKRTS